MASEASPELVNAEAQAEPNAVDASRIPEVGNDKVQAEPNADDASGNSEIRAAASSEGAASLEPQSEPSVEMAAAEPPVVQAEEEQAAPQTIAEEAVAEDTAMTDSSLKRKRSASKALCLEHMVSRIKSLQGEADRLEEAAKELQATTAQKEKEVEELKAATAAKQSEAEAKRKVAQLVSKDYLKKQCEVALEELDAQVPKRPARPYILFISEQKASGNSADGKTSVERWAALSEEEKKKYNDIFAQGMQKYNEWSKSEEGQKYLRERSELLKKCRADGKEELDKAMESHAVDDSVAAATVQAAPEEKPVKKRVKKAAGAEEAAALEETPEKKRRGRPPAGEPSSNEKAKQRRVANALAKGSPLDEQVLEAAAKSDMVAELRNLAGRPEVIALGKSSQELLDALVANKGMVNAAKHSLFST